MPATCPLHDLAMDLSHSLLFFNANRQHVDQYAKLELDQHSRISRIRRATENSDEELLRKTTTKDKSKLIAQ